MAFQISLNSTASVLNLEYVDGIKLNGPYEVCLKRFVTYNNIPNITEKNNKICFVDDTTNEQEPKKYEIIIPTGTYEIQDLIRYIQNHKLVVNSGTFLRLNRNTFKMEIKSPWYFDFTSPASIGKVLGFSEKSFKPDQLHTSDLPVQIFSVNTIKVKCNLIKCNYENLKRNDNTLYEFPLKVESGEKIIERPQTLCYYPVTRTDSIYQLHLHIVDQNDKLVDFQGEEISITLGFQPCK
jgi:hypothetical protein